MEKHWKMFCILNHHEMVQLRCDVCASKQQLCAKDNEHLSPKLLALSGRKFKWHEAALVWNRRTLRHGLG
ncbi:Hypothetical predicted protein [Podarcis lilfordi]|uniref:Uncharacterized protein n=1 Tax=Podarcis lilfordi TaxID=74358 RepID=A0AA35K7W2_9SAUR|nr:Hypothetical predicted protein [Podarcis lilfordi]